MININKGLIMNNVGGGGGNNYNVDQLEYYKIHQIN